MPCFIITHFFPLGYFMINEESWEPSGPAFPGIRNDIVAKRAWSSKSMSRGKHPEHLRGAVWSQDTDS